MSADQQDERAPGTRRVHADGYNAGYAELLYERSLRDRGLIPPSLAEWVENGREGPPPAAVREEAGRAAGVAPGPAPARADRLRLAAVAGSLVEAYRDHGHLAADLDPLGTPPTGHPLLKPDFYGIEAEALSSVPAAALGLERMGETVADALGTLREIYCGRIGYELDHVENPAERDWLIDYIESGRHREPLSDEPATALLERLSEVEGMERFLHRAYLGKKRFSIEGLDMMVPMLDELLERAAAAGTEEVVLGMAHRGRLNVLAHIIGRPYRTIVAEFEGEHERGVQQWVPEDGAGDVKYHLGAAGVVRTESGPVGIYMSPNPSHLEHVNPVVEGMARAARELRRRGERSAGLGSGRDADGARPGGRGGGGPHGEREGANPVLPVLIHGDAAFMGQGVVAETLNMCRLRGYETGGTVHFIANNQLGFTTDPDDGRSTRHASDLALGYRIPVIHVNADAPQACLAAARLAFDYRRAFGQDIVIDLVGYRRYGHNEGDEPAYTHPAMYRRIDEHPTVRAQWAERLVEAGRVSGERADEMSDAVADRLRSARDAVKEGASDPSTVGESGAGPEGDEEEAAALALRPDLTEPDREPDVETEVEEGRLLELNRAFLGWPEDLEVYEKLARQLEKRRGALEEGEPLDWAHAEALAFASLVTGGVAVRLTGEDSERGTFSQRHLVLHDVGGERSWIPMRHLADDQAPFQLWNSPLSEVATLGFEYGYSTIASESLVLWEAQFGDFVNVGQAIVDQFIAAGRSKWGQESRLTLLLPHGYEGQGPEHSSARLERFLQLAAGENLRVANPTTPAQYFHLLRLQALRPARRPLVVMTPKSLLRHPRARSELDALSGDRFRPVLPEPLTQDPAEVDRVLLCSGKVYYDLAGADAREEAAGTAIVRLERLYPFPEEELREALGALRNLDEVVWVQEEPANMGAWSYARPRLRELTGPEVAYTGRPPAASPAEGYASAHAEEQERIVREALTGG